MKNKNNLNDIILSFTNTGKLPTKFINCTKCNAEITAFGSNLEGKIKKFGTLFNLLTTFECRKCVSASKPKKEKKISVRKVKKEIKVERFDVPKMKFTTPRNVFLKDAPDIIQSCTQNNTCMSPQIYLNNGKSCDGCELFDHCQCTFKNWKYARA